MGSPYFVWINANEIISAWYLLGAVCVTPPLRYIKKQRNRVLIVNKAGNVVQEFDREVNGAPGSFSV
jgi:hypothetical protein